MSYYCKPGDSYGPQYPRQKYEPIGNGQNFIQGAPAPEEQPGATITDNKPQPRSDWLLFTDRLSDIARELGIVIEGEFSIRREEDSTAIVTNRYYLLGGVDAKPPRKVQWGQPKRSIPGPWNGADTQGFKPALASKIRAFEQKGVRFYEERVEDGVRVTARLGNMSPIRRTASMAESAFDGVCTAIDVMWVAALSSQRPRF